MLDELIYEYAKKFDENVPVFMLSLDKEELIEKIKTAIETNKPIEVEYNDGEIY